MLGNLDTSKPWNYIQSVVYSHAAPKGAKSKLVLKMPTSWAEVSIGGPAVPGIFVANRMARVCGKGRTVDSSRCSAWKGPAKKDPSKHKQEFT
jgi:hypothetical protein